VRSLAQAAQALTYAAAVPPRLSSCYK